MGPGTTVSTGLCMGYCPGPKTVLQRRVVLIALYGL